MRGFMIGMASALLAGISPAGLAQAQAAAPATQPAAEPNGASAPLLLQHPTLSATRIAFVYGGEIWVVPRSGGQAVRLVAGQGQLSGPIFSPDGSQIAFTGRYDGNTDVYVVPAAGGEPRRLTWHPGRDVAVGWSADGRSVLLRSPRYAVRDQNQLYTVPASGGAPAAVPLPTGEAGAFSPDGARIAYSPIQQWQPAWKQYRGGQTARIWVARLADGSVTPIPRPNSNDTNPLWIGDKVYFLSDRDGPVTLYSFDPANGAIVKLIDNARGFDIASAGAGPGGVVLDHFGKLEIYDIASGTVTPVPVTIAADLPQRRARYVEVKPDAIANARLSASGKRVLIETRGEILSAPADKGDVRNLTQSPGAADRFPAPSPDGSKVAWLSDESGEYALHIGAADGLGPVRKIALGAPPSFFYQPHWSPDAKKIVLADKRMNLWLVDLAKGVPQKIDADLFDSPAQDFNPGWSPDSQWVAYTKQLPSHLHAAFVYSLASGKATQITDGLSDVTGPRFDRSGKYLFFAATTATGLGAGWLDMSSMGRAVDRAVYVMVLGKDTVSPIAPQSDEEAKADDTAPGSAAKKPRAGKPDKADGTAEGADKPAAKDGDKPKPPAPVAIDFAGLDQRILALPIPRANIVSLETGKDGAVYVETIPPATTDADYLESEGPGPARTLLRFDLKERKTKTLAEGVMPGTFSLSADGSKLLLARKGAWIVADADKEVKDGDGALKLDDVRVWVDPQAEWKQIYNEAWRIERDFFYDPKLHGLDLDRARKLYARFLPGLAARQDLNVLLEEMTGHIGVGHTFINGGDMPEQQSAKVGLLGADYALAGGHWQIANILTGENWNPKLVAPLSQPGVAVKQGDFLLAVNGRPVSGDADVSRALDGTAGKQTVLTVGPSADGTGSRQVTVVPIASEGALRLHGWMEANRRKVDALSGGKLAYVYLPDTFSGGFANFNRYYFAQVGKKGAVLDERFNHGGSIADYIIDVLKRTPQMINQSREGADQMEPAMAIYGPKVMIINEMSGSGGDAMPWLFKKNAVGPLIGTRTWGGLVGIGGYPDLVDGGSITAPRWALYGTKGEWEVENIGIAPDIEVVQEPALLRQGHDPQLERAVAEALRLLEANPQPTFAKPATPDKKPVLPD
ncbi:S41 family peptidase [Novosphingobium sp. FKTRR1]|uniref:S41 family peptidase n=1 Tax=Novosphingobium sp. FKTRR1 TaxID=2879118 RepID=UPI001CF05216|nr:S41 family peptidase [Novosphingobium sp. FKTRR1]